MRKSPNPPKVGQLYKHPIYGVFSILEYENSRSVSIIFHNTCTVSKVQNKAIFSMEVRDYNHPHIFGVGYFGYGEFKSYVNGKITKAYSTWRSMLSRCYDKTSSNYRFYSDCAVVSEWHNFQNFAKWYNDRYFKGCHLDKDTLFSGNKLYSPNTCALIPMLENVSHATQKEHCFISPSGERVHFVNLNNFCKANNLDRTKMWAIKAGKRKTHKGWTYAP